MTTPAIPGPQPLEVLRALPRFQRDPLTFFADLFTQYGDVVRLPAGALSGLLVNHPSAARHVLQDNHRNYTKNTIQYNTLALVTGRGLLTTDGDSWLAHRRLMQPAFHRQRLLALGAAMTRAAERLAERWAAMPAPARVDVDAAMMQAALEVVGETLFSVDLSQAAPDMVRDTLTALDYIIYRAQNPLALPPAFPTPRNRQFKAALARLDAHLLQVIRARRAHPNPPADLLQMLLEARDADSQHGMTDAQIRDEVMTLVVAGHETVASALTWTWHLLGQHPAAVTALRAELRAVLGGRVPTVTDLPNLPYTRQVFDEALRLYPPAWLLTRQAVQEDVLTVDGRAYPVPAGSLVILSPYTLHRRADLWPEPEAFRPERFAHDPPRWGYLPFGGGPHLCIGNHFALMEGALMLATLAQRFDLRPTPHPVTVEALVTLRPKHGLLMGAFRVE